MAVRRAFYKRYLLLYFHFILTSDLTGKQKSKSKLALQLIQA